MSTVLGFIAILMWGFLAVFSIYTSHIPPFQLLFFCFSISALVVVLKRLWKRQAVLQKSNMTFLQWTVGVMGLFGFHFCYFMAIRYAPAIEVSLISYLWPLLLGIYVANKGEKVFAITGGVVGFTGTAILMLYGERIELNHSYSLGYMFAFLCALIWSGYSWFLSQSKSSVEDIGWISAIVAGLSLVSHFIFESTQWHMSAVTILNVALLGIGPVGGAFYLWDIGMKNGNRALLASISFATPVISSLALYFFGLAELSSIILMVITLVVLGAVISNSGQTLSKLFHSKV